MLAFTAIAFTSCYADNKEDLYRNFEQPDCDTTDVRFSTVIEPLISQNCAVPFCHNTSDRQSGLDLSNYNDIQQIANSGLLRQRITGTASGIMPPSGALPKCEVDKILRWVSNGAPNN